MNKMFNYNRKALVHKTSSLLGRIQKNFSFKISDFIKANGIVNLSGDNVLENDVVIVGGGIPGLSLATALQNDSNLNILVIDNEKRIDATKFQYSPERIPDLRMVSLTPASVDFFKSIGLWKKLDHKLIKKITGIQVYETSGSSFVHLDCRKDFIDDYLSYNIEIGHMTERLQSILNFPNNEKVKLLNTTLSSDKFSIDQSENYANLNLTDSEGKILKIRTKLIVASDGANSQIRNKLKLNTYGYSYHETGLVSTLKGNYSSDTSFQRFLHNGIFALLPLYDDYYSIVCSMPKNINENLSLLDSESFVKFVNKVLHEPSENDFSHLDRLDKNNNFITPPVIFKELVQRRSFPLQCQYTSDCIHNNVVLMGDAAHVVHPMAGQGLNLGIGDSEVLADTILESLRLGRRINERRSLEEYQKNRDINSKVMMTTMELIKQVYTPSNYLISGIRNLGMSLFNKSSLIKGLIIKSASRPVYTSSRYEA